jgi:hypothetical protein
MVVSMLMLVSLAADAPSFRCAEKLNATELAVCEDAELAAYDRAVALLYARARAAADPPGILSQRLFLRKRDACRKKRRCIVAAYRDWLNYYGWGLLFSGSQGNYRGLDTAFLYATPVGGDWYLFNTSAADAETSRSRPSSWAGGVVHISGGTGRFVERRGSTSCTIAFGKLPGNQWQITDNGGCGVIALTGTYGPQD